MERRDLRGAWQLPQEETGLGRDHVTLVRTSGTWRPYELPRDLQSSKTGLGQVQKWFLFRMNPGQRLVKTSSREARQIGWRPFAAVLSGVAPFRRTVYEALPHEFPEIANRGSP